MTKIIAHRGFSGKYPENTSLAFEKALELDCDLIELDIHLSKDGELVIIHDETLDRTTDGSGWVGENTLAQLKRLNAAARTKHAPQKIITLNEYFALIDNKNIVTNIEIKSGVVWYKDIEEKMLQTIYDCGFIDKVLISSFNHFSIKRVMELAPGIPTAFAEESRLVGLAEYAKNHGVAYFHPIFNTLYQEKILESLRESGIGVNVWTVNEERDMKNMLEMKVDGIITNFPDKLKKLCEEYS